MYFILPKGRYGGYGILHIFSVTLKAYNLGKQTKYETWAFVHRFHIFHISRDCNSKIKLSNVFYENYFLNILPAQSQKGRSQRLYHVEGHPKWRIKRYPAFQIANNKGADQIARMRGLVCAFDVCRQQNQVYHHIANFISTPF